MHAPILILARSVIWLGSMKHVLPDSLRTDAGKIMQAAFGVVMPVSCNDYMRHPTIKTFLEGTLLLLDQLASHKRMRLEHCL